MSTKSSNLSGRARENLLSRVASMRKAEKPAVEPAHDAAPQRDSRMSFSSQPAYEEIRRQQLIGEKIGVRTPFFRMHENRAGAETLIGNRTLKNFSSYDYLGLNAHPEVMEAAKAAIDRYGVSASASRHVAGERPVHRSFEKLLAEHYNVDDCVVLVSGYATNLGIIGNLVGAKDLLVYDSIVHNSIVMGGVASGAARRRFAHNDLDNLEHVLAANRGQFERTLIIIEGLYSMDGDYPDLRRIIEIKNCYDAWLMVDEAHALGVLGRRGYGIAEHCDVDPSEVDIWMGTISKTLSACGGYIAGSAELVHYIKSMAGVFVYSVGMPPVLAATAEKALQVLHREPERVARLQQNGATFMKLAKKAGLDTGSACGTAICPIIVKDSLIAVLLSQKLFERGINVQPVLYPAVPAKTSRLRFFLTCEHTEADMEAAIDATRDELNRMSESIAALKIPGA